MAAVGIGAELDLVHRQELGVAIERHGLDRAGEPARVRRDDLLFAGDQGHVADALLGHHAIVILASEQAEGKPDDARGMAQHALDGEMGLAGVRRAEDGFDAGGETGIQAGHGQMVGCCGTECKRFRLIADQVDRQDAGDSIVPRGCGHARRHHRGAVCTPLRWIALPLSCAPRARTHPILPGGRIARRLAWVLPQIPRRPHSLDATMALSGAFHRWARDAIGETHTGPMHTSGGRTCQR